MGSILVSHGNHNRRQRKKLRLGEFQELGFDILAHLAADADQAALDGLLDALLEQAIVPNGLLFIGNVGKRLVGIVINASSHQSATEAQRTAVQTWLQQRPELKDIEVGPLRDVHYSPSSSWLGLN